MCLILNAFQDSAVWIYKYKSIVSGNKDREITDCYRHTKPAVHALQYKPMHKISSLMFWHSMGAIIRKPSQWLK